MPRKKTFYEHYKRSLAKAVTFRIAIIVTDFFVISTITGRRDVALGVIIISSITHTALYFFHERFWVGIHWGKNHH